MKVTILDGRLYLGEAERKDALTNPFLFQDRFLITLALLLSPLMNVGNTLHKDRPQLGGKTGIDA